MTTTIRSIERKRIPVPVTSAGQSASFALKRVRRKDVRKGMVVLPRLEGVVPTVHREFVAEGELSDFLMLGLVTCGERDVLILMDSSYFESCNDY